MVAVDTVDFKSFGASSAASGFGRGGLLRLGAAMLGRLPPNTAHAAAIRALKYGLVPRPPDGDDPVLACRLWGRAFPNPIGLAAGFDKNAEVVDGLLALGFGFVEAGTVTPRPQAGNPRPNLFRLEADEALINRLGFNNDGLDAFTRRLASRPGRGGGGIVGANLGSNRDSADAPADYAHCVRTLAGLADYLVVNVSSPNTPGLRGLQQRGRLSDLIGRVMAARNHAPQGSDVPVVVKIAPDLTPDEMADIAEVALASGIDGLIVANTTVARPDGLKDAHRSEAGGLSGPPLRALSAAALREMYRLTGGRIPLIGCGGVSTGADAYALIRSGASMVQIFTAFVYHGTAVLVRIKQELATLLRADGFSCLAEATATAAATEDAAA